MPRPTKADLEAVEQDRDAYATRLSKVEAVAYQRELEIRRLRRSIARENEAVQDLTRLVESYRDIQSENLGVAAWTRLPPVKTGRHHGTPVLMLSDLHLDEIVSLSEMDGLNSYNREIAELRLHRVIESTVELLTNYVTGLTYDGLVLCLGGDIITGEIHEELAKTNEAPVAATIVHWLPILAAAIERLGEVFGQVQVYCVDGNHDRTGKFTPYKRRAESSNAWIIYNTLAMLLADQKNITFEVSKAPEILFKVYDTSFLLTHGDAFRGGGGVGGIWPPMMRWLKAKKNVRHFDIALIGHWHQLIYGPEIFVNGSLKGYDEYATGHAFGFERPQQMLFVVTPENGVTHRLNVYADSDRERTLWA